MRGGSPVAILPLTREADQAEQLVHVGIQLHAARAIAIVDRGPPPADVSPRSGARCGASRRRVASWTASSCTRSCGTPRPPLGTAPLYASRHLLERHLCATRGRELHDWWP